MYKRSSWAFNQQVAEEFDKHVRQSVPQYEELQEMIAQLSDFFVQIHSVVYDLGCGTGETIQKINNRHENKRLQFVGVDNSVDMLMKAQVKNKESEQFQWVNQSLESFEFLSPTPLVLSILTLQFLNKQHRRGLLEKIYKQLEIGGAFILVEKVLAKDSAIQDIFSQSYHDFKEVNGFSAQEILMKDKSLRGVLNPLHQKEMEELLLSVGFKTIEVFHKTWNFVGWIAIK